MERDILLTVIPKCLQPDEHDINCYRLIGRVALKLRKFNGLQV